MTIEFIKFANHTLEKRYHGDIKEALLNCLNDNTYYHWLNIVYNNSNHFNNMSYNYDITKLLKEVHQIANSPGDKLVVMGGIHQDTGHSSSLVLYNPSAKRTASGARDAYVSDTYIRFRIELKSPRKLSVLIPGQIFHFLVNNPIIQWTSHNTGTFFVYNIPPEFNQENAQRLFPIDQLNRPIIRLV
jgi:hypothetical protein